MTDHQQQLSADAEAGARGFKVELDSARAALLAERQFAAEQAHRLGYWIRFYTLDGFQPAEGPGWDDGYNFGSQAAVRARWKAALAAGVNFIATDQYEDLAAVMGKGEKP